MGLNNTNLTSLVRKNLVHYQLWTSVVESVVADTAVLCGLPPNKLSNDDEQLTEEYVLPVELSQYNSDRHGLTLHALDEVFNGIQDPTVKRITLAIVSDDGTVVYYFVYRGLYRPKRN